ncbi:hypothetical protein K438DRAFT_2101411 [Mycena galopus ATCC 62051]|nr:hypothetical protein K438DRAFT_2101411 [Mycena galopus ATCC 62051]
MAASKWLTAKNNTANRETGNTMKAEFATRCFAARERTPVNWRRMEGSKESQDSSKTLLLFGWGKSNPIPLRCFSRKNLGASRGTPRAMFWCRRDCRSEMNLSATRISRLLTALGSRAPPQWCGILSRFDSQNSMGSRDDLALAKGPRDESGLQRVAIEDFSNNPDVNSSAGSGTPNEQPSTCCTREKAKKERYLHDSDRGCVAISLGRLAFALATEECSRWFVWTAVMSVAKDRVVTRGLTCAADGLDLEVKRTERDGSSNTEGADQKETDLLGEGKFLVARLWKRGSDCATVERYPVLTPPSTSSPTARKQRRDGPCGADGGRQKKGGEHRDGGSVDWISSETIERSRIVECRWRRGEEWQAADRKKESGGGGARRMPGIALYCILRPIGRMRDGDEAVKARDANPWRVRHGCETPMQKVDPRRDATPSAAAHPRNGVKAEIRNVITEGRWNGSIWGDPREKNIGSCVRIREREEPDDEAEKAVARQAILANNSAIGSGKKKRVEEREGLE